MDNKMGKLFGIGVGPGDPELLTLKAVHTIQKCRVIAVPVSGGEKAAFSIVRQYLDGKELLDCHFAMEKDMAKREEARCIAAERIIHFLNEGKNVGFVALGDPTTYSTYMYVHRIIVERGLGAEIVPGITSYTAAAAALGVALCENDEALTIFPTKHCGNIDELLSYPGNKVIMKSGEQLGRILAEIKEHGYGNHTKIAYRVAMEGQQLYQSIEDYEKAPETGYFTIVIMKEG
jgi:precorrin-2/cobalt-factor-2 C20-methyltransferase